MRARLELIRRVDPKAFDISIAHAHVHVVLVTQNACLGRVSSRTVHIATAKRLEARLFPPAAFACRNPSISATVLAQPSLNPLRDPPPPDGFSLSLDAFEALHALRAHS